MIRFTRIFDHVTRAEQSRLAAVQEIFRKSFPDVPDGPAKLARMLEQREDVGFDVVLLVALDARDKVRGFALIHYYKPIATAYLDYIAVDPDVKSRGLGSALYEAVREHMLRKGARALLMDVPPDQAELVSDPARLAPNRARLRFYERYGARPIDGTAYQEKWDPAADYDPPHLVLDPLGHDETLSKAAARKAVSAIFELRYGWDPDHPYVKRIVASIQDDPVRLRAARYVKEEDASVPEGRLRPLTLLVAEHHEFHHVRERGYVQRPVRIDAILRGLKSFPHERREVVRHSEAPIRAVHDGDFVTYLTKVCTSLGPKEALYPYVFPIRRPDRKPLDRSVQAGYYCIDTFTPLSQGALRAARSAVDCAVTGADRILAGDRLVYALCRPPGHHAERRSFGGFCYFNNAAIAAHRLSPHGKVAFLDIDYHHGNGSQDIFYKRDDVLFQSIHGHPRHSYPYFSGFEDERGEGAGEGFNINHPLPEGVDDEGYLRVLRRAMRAIEGFQPRFLVLSLGLDILRGDPTGTFTLTAPGLERVGTELGALKLPTLVVQEGGYLLRNLAPGARGFMTGLARSWY